MILISHFQFPEETENTQSPAANKIGKYNLVIRVIGLTNSKQT